MKELFEDSDREKAAREMTVKIAKEKIKVVDTAEKKAAAVEKARALAKKGPQNSWRSKMKRT